MGRPTPPTSSLGLFHFPVSLSFLLLSQLAPLKNDQRCPLLDGGHTTPLKKVLSGCGADFNLIKQLFASLINAAHKG